MGGKGKKRAWLALVACAALALVVAFCGCSGTPESDEGQTETAAEEMSVRVKSPEGSIEWGTTLTAVVFGAPKGAELTYDWQLWSTKQNAGELICLPVFSCRELPRAAATARDPPPCAPNAFNELNITCLIPPCFARMPSS